MRKSPYRLFFEHVREQRLAYAFGMLAMLITSISEVMMPKFIQWAIEVATGKSDIPAIFQRPSPHDSLDLLVWSLLGFLCLGWLGRILWRQILARQSHIAGHKIKTRIWDVLKDQPLSLLDRYSLGDLMNRATADWNKTRFIHGFTIVMTFDLIFFTLLATVSMLLIDVKITLLCLAIVPFLPKPITRIAKNEYRLHDFAQEQLSLLSDLISQVVNTVRLQRSTASEGVWNERLKSYADEYAKRQFEVLKVGWHIFILGALPTLFAYFILFTYGIFRVNQGTLSVGEFIAIQSYVLLLQTPLFELGNNISEWQTGFASYKRISDIFALESPSDLPLTPAEDRPMPVIVTKGLSVQYGDHTVLDKIDLKVDLGERVGFMGPIGSGKTTLVQAIAGLSETFEGQIWIAGASVEMANRDWMTKQITMVPQKPFLFAGSIRHNLSPAQELSDEVLIEALRCVELWGDVAHFPEGLESWIGEWGINLSGGQKQRLSLARALLKPSPVLILDDCLSAVDSVTEARILKNMNGFLKDRAVLWTAHRLSTLQLCNRIYRMNEGRLEAVSEGEEPRRNELNALLETSYATP